MNKQEFSKIARTTAKKIFKTGLFQDIEIDIKNLAIRFKDSRRNLYVWQTFEDDFAGFFSIGHVTQWTEQAPTFESEYNTIGDVPRARFNIHFSERTDNPDYILRASRAYLLG